MTPLATSEHVGPHRRSTFVGVPAREDAGVLAVPGIPGIPEWTRRYEDERRESTSVLRGLFFAGVFAAPLIAVVGAGVFWFLSLLP